MHRPSSRGVFFILFALSGFSGLIYESLWTHYLKLFLGHAAYAQTLVLAIFMGGMALGSAACSRWSSQLRNPLGGYALAEALIGLWALVFHWLFTTSVDLSFEKALPALGSSTAVTLFKWSVSAAMILPPAMLLGATFPLMSAGILRRFPERTGQTLAMLYFTNSVGAAIGVLVSGFWLIGALGLPGTIRLAGLINLALALLVWRLAAPHGLDDVPAGQHRCELLPGVSVDVLLAVSLLTGASSFAYEIGWIRMLSLVLGTSTHAFELMLSAFIFGLAFGGLWIQRLIDRLAQPLRTLGWVQVLMGLLALGTLALYGQTFDLMRGLVASLPKTDAGYLLFNLGSNGLALAIMLPATFCAGMTLPLITFLLLRTGHGEKSIGSVYAANTVGAIAGVFLSVHAGLPLLGLKGLIAAGATVDLALGLWLLGAFAARQKQPRPLWIAAGLSAAGLVLTLGLVQLDAYKMASGVFRIGQLMDPAAFRLLFHQDGKTATVSVVANPAGEIALRTNGKPDASIASPTAASTPDEATAVLLAAIPMMLSPEARSAAVIGLGSGLTTQALLENPRLGRVDTIEIEEQIVRGAQHYRPLTDRVFTDPRSAIHLDDAKTFFSATRARYDLIVSEPSNPWVSGVAGLFSTEFYGRVSAHLAPGGLFVQWLQLYEIDLELVASVLKALSASFLDYQAYAANHGDLIVVARRDGPVPALTPELFELPGLRGLLERVYVRGPQDLALRKIATRASLQGLLATYRVPANSDYFPVLDQNAARARFLSSSAQELTQFQRDPFPALELLSAATAVDPATRITPSPHYPPTERAFWAMALRDLFREGTLPQGYGSVPPEYVDSAMRLRRAFSDCSAPSERVALLYDVAVSMIPHLTLSELDAFWSQLEALPCGGARSDEEKAWAALLKAVGRRDTAAMLELAPGLLERSSELPLGPKKYLLGAALFGAVAAARPDQAQRLWASFSPMLDEASRKLLLFRYLVAHTGHARHEAGGPP